jgi:uncharacterized protein (TIGR03437 family)
MRLARAILLFSVVTGCQVFGQGLVWDSSGNSMLSGTYYFRDVAWVASSSSSAGYALFGSVTFSGNGTYTMNTPTYLEAGEGSEVESSITGTYSIGAGGFGYLSDPLSTSSGSTIRGMVANGIFIGSNTEGGYNNLFIAAQIPTSNTFSGTYNMAYMNFPSLLNGYPYDAQFTLSPNGSGSLGTVSASGYYYGSTTLVTQSAGSVKYTSSNGGVVVTYPNLGNSTYLLSGQQVLYFSPDGNFVFGGSSGANANSSQADMVIGVKGSGGILNASVFYNAGAYADSNEGDLDNYYGSFGNSNGLVIQHQRIFSAGDAAAYSSVVSGTLPTTSTTTYSDPYLNYTVGDSGKVRIGFGTANYPGIDIALAAPSFSGTGVYLNPTSVVNAASYAPFTAGLAPGELIVMTGTNLSPASGGLQVAKTSTFPTNIGGVQILIDGVPAPLYYVSPTQCAAIIPYDSSEFSFASIQVNNNGTLSNKVTEFLDDVSSPTASTSPGVFTNPADGVGYAAALHADYSLITNANPAQPGEAISVYLTGLGQVFPTITDGAPGGSSTLNYTVQTITAAVDDTVNAVATATVSYAGLAPGYAGLYQINLTVPTGINAGDDYLVIEGPDTYSEEAIIPIGSGGTAAYSPVRAKIDSGEIYKSTQHRRPHTLKKPVFVKTAQP